MDRNRTPYLDRLKWWGPSFLIHALVAAAILYPFASDKETANSSAALHAIAVVFAPQPQTLTAPVPSSTRLDSPKPAPLTSKTATGTVPASKTPVKLNARATPAKTEPLSEPMATPRHLPKARPATPIMRPTPVLEAAKAPPTDNAPAPHLPQTSRKISSSKILEKNTNTLNKHNFYKTDVAALAAPVSISKTDIKTDIKTGAPPGSKTDVTASKHSKAASLSAPTLSDKATARSIATTENAAALADAADMDQVKSWGQNVRGTLVRLTKGLRSRGSAKVAIRLARTGELIGVTFIEKSQNARFNRELDRRIKTSAIFPAAPHGLAIDEMLFPIRLTVTR